MHVSQNFYIGFPRSQSDVNKSSKSTTNSINQPRSLIHSQSVQTYTQTQNTNNNHINIKNNNNITNTNQRRDTLIQQSQKQSQKAQNSSDITNNNKIQTHTQTPERQQHLRSNSQHSYLQQPFLLHPGSNNVSKNKNKNSHLKYSQKNTKTRMLSKLPPPPPSPYDCEYTTPKDTLLNKFNHIDKINEKNYNPSNVNENNHKIHTKINDKSENLTNKNNKHNEKSDDISNNINDKKKDNMKDNLKQEYTRKPNYISHRRNNNNNNNDKTPINTAAILQSQSERRLETNTVKTTEQPKYKKQLNSSKINQTNTHRRSHDIISRRPKNTNTQVLLLFLYFGFFF